jgi:hypothetical protein
MPPRLKFRYCRCFLIVAMRTILHVLPGGIAMPSTVSGCAGLSTPKLNYFLGVFPSSQALQFMLVQALLV